MTKKLKLKIVPLALGVVLIVAGLTNVFNFTQKPASADITWGSADSGGISKGFFKNGLYDNSGAEFLKAGLYFSDGNLDNTITKSSFISKMNGLKPANNSVTTQDAVAFYYLVCSILGDTPGKITSGAYQCNSGVNPVNEWGNRLQPIINLTSTGIKKEDDNVVRGTFFNSASGDIYWHNCPSTISGLCPSVAMPVLKFTYGGQEIVWILITRSAVISDGIIPGHFPVFAPKLTTTMSNQTIDAGTNATARMSVANDTTNRPNSTWPQNSAGSNLLVNTCLEVYGPYTSATAPSSLTGSWKTRSCTNLSPSSLAAVGDITINTTGWASGYYFAQSVINPDSSANNSLTPLIVGSGGGYGDIVSKSNSYIYIEPEETIIIINTYAVVFKNWDGTTLKTQTVNHGTSASAPANPSRTGYDFTGWDKAFNNVMANLTVTAQYAIKSYTVVFKNWDGTVLKTQTVNYGANATAPATPSRTGYTFSGWDASFNNVTNNITVTAQFVANDGGNLPKPPNAGGDEEVGSLPNQQPTDNDLPLPPNAGLIEASLLPSGMLLMLGGVTNMVLKRKNK